MALKGNKYALGNDGGRPSSYKPEYCQEIIDFFNREAIEIIQEEKAGKDGPFTVSKMVGCKLPTFERFAFSIGVHRATLLNWCEVHPEFFDAYKKAKDLQKDILIQNGLLGFYDKTAFIFTAKNCTDMRDQQLVEQTITSKIQIEKEDEGI